ncbi:MAG TPA: ATP-binding protein [Ktedonobacteraceae bacterium]|nr:ATP-binding protein [Ktedonobacteraceae bacterium]
MDKMTSNMLLLARIDAGQLPLEWDVLNLGQVAEGVVRRVQALADRANITLVFQQEEVTYALGDWVLLEQAMLVLLDNTLKYTQSGGKVGVYTFMENGCACLRVSDTGIGIAPTDLSRLGERFYRVDKARSREAGGHGLQRFAGVLIPSLKREEAFLSCAGRGSIFLRTAVGLSITRGIVAAHRGKLTLTSELASVTLLLPTAQHK